MTDLRKAKFVVRVVLTIGIIAFGVAIFFLSHNTSMRWAGVTMVTNAWMIWMSSGKAKKSENSASFGFGGENEGVRTIEDPPEPPDPHED